MSDSGWLRGAAIALAVLGGLVLIGLAFSAGDGLEGQPWVVTQMSDDGALSAPVQGSVITANFDDGAVGGIAGCNTYFGSYEAEAGDIAVFSMGTTLMFCEAPPGVMDQEAGFLQRMQSTTRYQVKGNELRLIADDAVVLVFERVKPDLHD